MSSVQLTGITPYLLTLPRVGLNPTTPLYEAGRKTEPTVWEPRAAGHIREATDTADPLLDPPGVWSGFHGLIVGDGSPQANSVVTVLPNIIAPACLSFDTVVAS